MRWKMLAEKLDQDHHAKIVERQVNRIDRRPLDEMYQGVGSTAYDPVTMLKMVLYQYLKGNQSPASWGDEAELNEAMQWLGRGYQPARRTWYDFRDRVGHCVEKLHQQIVSDAVCQDVLDPRVGVQDGTSVAACASRHRMVNQPTLQKRQRQLASVLSGEDADQSELPRWLPPTGKGRIELAARMEVAAEVLNERIAKNAKRPKDKRRDSNKIQVSLSDPFAPLGRDKMKVFRPLYTAQYVVAPESHLIVAYECQASVTDVGRLLPMIDKLQAMLGNQFQTMLADSAYCSIVDLRGCRKRGVELVAPVQEDSWTAKKKQSIADAQISRDQFVWLADENAYQCPQGHRLSYAWRERKERHSGHTLMESRYRCSAEACGSCPLAARCLRAGSKSRMVKRLEGQELLDEQRAKMKTAEAQALYALRSQTVERAFGDRNQNRRLTRLHGRGPSRALAETGLMVLAQNVLRLDRLTRKRANCNEDTT